VARLGSRWVAKTGFQCSLTSWLQLTSLTSAAGMRLHCAARLLRRPADPNHPGRLPSALHGCDRTVNPCSNAMCAILAQRTLCVRRTRSPLVAPYGERAP
jgi:hypothetical protein